jgi:uncharacterized protein YutE (UPF0331/DUF86 family)
MTLIERLLELRRHLDHLREIRPRVESPVALDADLSLRNDVFHSLLIVCQAVIDLAGLLSARRGLRFQDYREAIANLAKIEGMPKELAIELEGLPGFRNVLVHEYVDIDPMQVIRALDRLDSVERFAGAVSEIASAEDESY